ncbi:hypothetical protein KR009_005438, partial [Drosophila setifemur]
TTAACPLDVSRSSRSGTANTTASTRQPEPETKTKTKTEPETEPLPPPPSSVDRRRPNRIWSLLVFALIMCQLQQIAHPGGGGGGGAIFSGLGGVAAAPLSASTPSPSISPISATAAELGGTSNLQKHLQKRHHPALSFRQRFQREMNSSRSQLDWQNTCGGNWPGPEKIVRTAKRCKKKQMIMKVLANQTGKELRRLQGEDKARATTNSERELATGANKVIDISNMRQWFFHSSQYKFLPRLNASSQQLNLRHVHRDLQFYVGAFSYMRHAKLHWDFANLQTESAMAGDLERIRGFARAVLCSVELAINATNRLYPAHSGKVKERLFRTMSRQLMEKRLQQFKTPLVQLHSQAASAARGLEVEPPTSHFDQLATDALFAKRELVKYVRTIRQILKRQRKA